MAETSLFTNKEATELILGFYTFTCGFWEHELEQCPEAKRFVEMGCTKKDEEYDDLYILSEKGEKILHNSIKSISENFIKYMKRRGFELSITDTAKWFQEELELDTIEDGEDIAQYICGNLYHYGYRVRKCHSSRKGNFYQMDKYDL